MIKILHTSDLHLEKQLINTSYPYRYAEERREAIWDSLKYMLDYAVKNNIDFFLISGDLYESEFFGYKEIYRLKNLFSKYPKLKILIISGNHDIYSDESVYKKVKMPENIHIFSSDKAEFIEFSDLKTRIYGISWIKSSHTDIDNENLKLELSSDFINILMLHSDIFNRSEYMYVNIEKLKELKFDYIALGHIHKYSIIDNRIIYPGCPEPTDFGENGMKGCVLVELDKRNINTEFIEISKRKFIIKKIQIDELMNEEDIIRLINNSCLDNDFYRIILEGNCNEELFLKLDFILKSIEDDFYYIEFINNISINSSNNLVKVEDDIFIKTFIDIVNSSNEEIEIKNKAIDRGLRLLAGDYSEVDY